MTVDIFILICHDNDFYSDLSLTADGWKPLADSYLNYYVQ